jgi:hypothetical protein
MQVKQAQPVTQALELRWWHYSHQSVVAILEATCLTTRSIR